MDLTDAKSVREAWNNLKKAYEDSGLFRTLVLMRALIKIEYNKFSSMHEYINEVLSLSQRPADIGNPVEDKFLAVILLAE